MKKEVSAIIEARLNSRRLKGKVLKKLENVELLLVEFHVQKILKKLLLLLLWIKKMTK